MTTIALDAQVEHVYPYADVADQPVLVWDITLSTPDGSLTLSFGTPRGLSLSPGQWLRVTIEDLGDIVMCIPDACQRESAPDSAAHAA